jgi:hypothetical protein
MRKKSWFGLNKAAFLGGSLLLLLGFVLVASADARSPIWRPRPQPSFAVSLQGEGGERLRTFQHSGQTFVLGQPGERYSIRIHNPSARRVEAVVSVDGRDAISGDAADFVRQRGYVIAPFGSVTVDGFRTSLQQVASFRFTDPENSYSARRGTPENVGVIGVAFFPERQLETPKVARRESGRRPAKPSASAPGAAERSDSNRLGTEFGESRMSSVTEVSFTREQATRPARVVTLRYDDASGLRARGIEVFERPWRPASIEPQAFPRSRFAAPPPERF